MLDSTLHVAWIGDCRAVRGIAADDLGVVGRAITEDHSLRNPAELHRVLSLRRVDVVRRQPDSETWLAGKLTFRYHPNWNRFLVYENGVMTTRSLGDARVKASIHAQGEAGGQGSAAALDPRDPRGAGGREHEDAGAGHGRVLG